MFHNPPLRKKTVQPLSWGTTGLFAMVVLGFLASCRPSIRSPEEQLMAVAQAAQSGQLRLAWNGLSKATQEQIKKQYKELENLAGSSIPDEDIIQMTFATQGPPAHVDHIETIEKNTNQAVVAVTSGGKTTNQTLVFEEGQWKLDWTSLLQPIVETP